MLKSLTIKLLLGRMITISSINLTCLNFSTYKLVNICIGELPYLDSAYVSIPYPRVPTDGFAYDAGKLFLGIYNVKDTRITNGLLLAIIYVSKMSEHIPTFYNLIHLKVSRITSPWFNEWMKFLVKTPNLEHLDLLQVHEQRWNY